MGRGACSPAVRRCATPQRRKRQNRRNDRSRTRGVQSDPVRIVYLQPSRDADSQIHTERPTHMSSPSNQANERQTVVENIDQYLADGRAVFDKNGKKVGDVKMYSTAAGYLVLGSG